jgi:hypothetical protein
VGYVKAAELKSVLAQYKKEKDAGRTEKGIPPVNDSTRKSRTDRTNPVTPLRPNGVQEEEEDSQEEEDSDALLAGGKYQYLERVRPVKVNLNPTASVAAKPAPRRKKRGRNTAEDEADPRAAKRPSIIHEDPDARMPDDTGFLSDLDPVPQQKTRKNKRTKRLSRLQQHRIREPHWQRDLAPVQAGDVAISKDAAVDAEEMDLHDMLAGLGEIPDNATVTERREMEELRLSIEQRIWRIMVLRIQERARGAEEHGGQEDVKENGNGKTTGRGRVLRKRKEKNR